MTIRIHEHDDGAFSVSHGQQVSRWDSRGQAVGQAKEIHRANNQKGQVFFTDKDGLETNITREVNRLLTRNRGRQTRRRWRAA